MPCSVNEINQMLRVVLYCVHYICIYLKCYELTSHSRHLHTVSDRSNCIEVCWFYGELEPVISERFRKQG